MWVLITVLVTLILPVVCLPDSANMCTDNPECHCQDNGNGTLTAICDVYQLSNTIYNLPETINSLIIKCILSENQTISNSLFDKFTNLTYFSLEQCHFYHIESYTFDIVSLKAVTIRNCGIKNATLRMNSSSLQSVEITNCNITSFPEISNIVDLSYLNVSFNKLADYGSFEAECERENSVLSELDLSYNELNRLPVLSNCTLSLKTFRFSRNPSTEIDINYFHNFESLQILDLSETPLNSDISSMDTLTNLTTLKLYGNGQIFSSNLQTFPFLVELELRNFVAPEGNILSNISSLTHLVSLTLVSFNIKDIQLATFDNMTQLKVLDLSRNSIRLLRRGVFDSLTHLKILDLSYNNIGSIFSGAITPPSLIHLDISSNQITYVSSQSFDDLTNLRMLNLSYNKISSLQNNTFNDSVFLQNLFLNNNRMKSLPSFVQLEQLLHLDLKNNRLTFLAEDTFNGLKSLLGMSLRNNNITALPSRLLKDSSKITFLDFSYNLIQFIEKHPDYSTPWGHLSELILLRLDNNKIRTLNDELSYFTKLQFLFLDNNLLSKILPDMFPSSLVGLELSYNHISYFSNIFRKLTQLHTLSIQGNYPYLTRVPFISLWVTSKIKPTVFIGFNEFQCDCNMEWLKVLTLPDFELPTEYRYLPTFVDLTETYCKNPGPGLIRLTDYPATEFVCSYEKDEFECPLDCICCQFAGTGKCSCAYWCPVDCICRKATEMFRKNEIMCRNKNKTTIPPALPPDSTTIDLSSNNITVLDNNSFPSLPQLEHLYLNNNNINSLSTGCFDGVTNLVTLYLNDNNITVILSGIFSRLGSLQKLYLHNNNVVKIYQDSFVELNSLKSLTLHSNDLDSVESLKFMYSLSGNVTLSHNSWSCECDFMDSFLDVIVSNALKISDISDMTCSWPDETIIPANITLDDNQVQVLDFDYRSWCSNNTVIFNNTNIRQVIAYDNRYIGTIIGLTLLSIFLITLGIVLIWKRRIIQVIVYDKFGVRLPVPVDVAKEQREFTYDAFICFGENEENFVVHELIEKLENEKKFKLCLNFRDFPVGESKADCIVEAVDNSRKTILIVSKSFLQDDWCKFEFQTAHHVMLTEHAENLIVILKEKIDDDLLDPDLRLLLKRRTYVEYGDPWFWEKLYFVMPDPKIVGKDNKGLNVGDIEFDIVDNKV
ncbi:hypothetical protein LOTGIDRAFT_228902 [Lottia gigantea]|uniref:TIR domain-containing protein n=1 Tax=Lottia gigantea TaxID=225164 RepID=V4A1Z0_LOTGI|nr:hypothetical protein LOTGIDRAFT_228902 [Lottia gigantea]ESO88930.1 hypothetical protein LOTGIDRAFT_228902 [Lottia gigantea]